MRLTRSRLSSLGWIGAVLIGTALSCSIARERDAPTGVHPAGWATEGNAAFHGDYLRSHGEPLADCRVCHGDDYGGGAVMSSCTTSGCHEKGVEQCGTCHDSASGLPMSGAHDPHASFCADCHVVPKDARQKEHPNGSVEVVFSGLANAGGDSATWDTTTETCASVYCHGGREQVWAPAPEPLGCDACHDAPPPSHERFSRVSTTRDCVGCHPAPPDERHLDGALEMSEASCDTCHGQGPLGAPPPALDGSEDPLSRGVGAHRRHLDKTLADRIGQVAACDDCHMVPTSVLAEGHLDTEAPADVRLWLGGSYEVAEGRCVSACHWDRDPGPAWTDASGAERACDACHGFPPEKTRKGTAHPSVTPDLAACLGCHDFDVSRHVDGHVDLK